MQTSHRVVRKQGVFSAGQGQVVGNVAGRLGRGHGRQRVTERDPLVESGELPSRRRERSAGWPSSTRANGLAESISALVMSRSSSS